MARRHCCLSGYSASLKTHQFIEQIWTTVFPCLKMQQATQIKIKIEKRGVVLRQSVKVITFKSVIQTRKSQGSNHHSKHVCTATQTAAVKSWGPSWKGPNALRIQDLCSEPRALHPSPFLSFKETSQRMQTSERAVPRTSSPHFVPQREKGNGKIQVRQINS